MTTTPCRVYDGKCVAPSRCLDRCARQHSRRRQDAEAMFGPLYPDRLRCDSKPRAVYPQGARP